jgi:catechol 2,3-dioxygenase-like lactoylglutathione lyase family enzyme
MEDDRAHPAAVGLRHVALRFRELEAAERFFTEVLGYRVEWRPDEDDVYLTRAGDNVALHRAQAVSAGASLLDHIGLLVPRAEDVDAWALHLDRLGARVTARPRTHRDGARSLYVEGPEGLIVQILHHPPALSL